MQVTGPGRAADFAVIKNEQAVQQAPEQRTIKAQAELKQALSEPQQTQGEPESRKMKLEDAVELANTAMKISIYQLQFKIHEESGKIQVKVVDEESGEVIREIPPEQMLEIAAGIKEMLEKFDKMVGVLVDKLA